MVCLVACEESQRTTIALRSLGHEAYSCDIQDCSGGHPEWHLKQDVLPLLSEPWDLLIAHPPCTFLSYAANHVWNTPGREYQRQQAARFFMSFVTCRVKKVAIENPLGYMSVCYRKPDQIIHPYMFGDPYKKRTCLWLRNLPLLVPTDIVEPLSGCWTESITHDRSRERSKTFPGIAWAMASQFTQDFPEQLYFYFGG